VSSENGDQIDTSLETLKKKHNKLTLKNSKEKVMKKKVQGNHALNDK
jgi:hypothetical protein